MVYPFVIICYFVNNPLILMSKYTSRSGAFWGPQRALSIVECFSSIPSTWWWRSTRSLAGSVATDPICGCETKEGDSRWYISARGGFNQNLLASPRRCAN